MSHVPMEVANLAAAPLGSREFTHGQVALSKTRAPAQVSWSCGQYPIVSAIARTVPLMLSLQCLVARWGRTCLGLSE